MGGGPPNPTLPATPDQQTVGGYSAQAAVATTGHVVTFNLKGVAPPSNLYISPDDQLFVSALSTVTGETLSIFWRTLGTDGYIHQGNDALVMTSIGSSMNKLIPLGEGFLLNVEVSNSLTTTQRGQFHFAVYLFRGGSVAAGSQSALLLQDYVDGFTAMGWPGGRIISSVEGPGAIRSIVGTTPAAGVDISETVPARRRWRLQSFLHSLTTSVTVANRQVQLRITDGTNVLWVSEVEATQAASLTNTYSWAVGSGTNQTTFQVNTISRTLAAMVLEPGWKIQTVTTAIQAADQWTAPNYSVEEWISV